MSATIPVDCKGRRCSSEATLGLVPSPTAAQKAAITTYPNGTPYPPGTGIDTNWRFTTPQGVVASDGTKIPFISYQRGGQHGMLMAVMLKNPGKSYVDQNQDVRDYRTFLDAYTGSSADLVTKQNWLDYGNALYVATGYPPTLTMANIDADINQAQNNPWWNQSQG